MEYVVFFLLGAATAASGLVIWYYGYVTLLRKERQAVKEQDNRLSNQSATLTQQFATLEHSRRELEASFSLRTQSLTAEFESKHRQLDEATAAFNARTVHYDDLFRENSGLKQDLFNLSVQLRKMERDQAAIARRQEEIDQRTNELANRYLKENVSNGMKLSSKSLQQK